MKRWQALVGVGLLIVLAQLALGGAGKKNVLTAQPSAVPKHFLEVGRSYGFASPNNNIHLEKCKVVEQPHDNWVKVRVREGDRSITAWINLNNVEVIMPHREDD